MPTPWSSSQSGVCAEAGAASRRVRSRTALAVRRIASFFSETPCCPRSAPQFAFHSITRRLLNVCALAFPQPGGNGPPFVPAPGRRYSSRPILNRQGAPIHATRVPAAPAVPSIFESQPEGRHPRAIGSACVELGSVWHGGLRPGRSMSRSPPPDSGPRRSRTSSTSRVKQDDGQRPCEAGHQPGQCSRRSAPRTISATP
jgi:hypothetical protein